MNNEVIPVISEYDSLLKEIRELQARIVELTALRDDLIYHICPALRARYEEKIGCIEREILAAKLYLKEKQRILEILQAQFNRREIVSLNKAEEAAGEEFRGYEEELHRKAEEQEEFRRRWKESQWEQHDSRAEEERKKQKEQERTAGANGDGENGGADGREDGESGKDQKDNDADGSGTGSEEAGNGHDGDDPDGEGGPSNGSGANNIVEELKRLYRKIVKRLHPDVHPNQTEREKELFNEAVAAYEAGDLDRLRAIWEELENGIDPEERFENKPEDLKKMRELVRTLQLRVQMLSAEIAHIRSEFPYTMKEFLEDEEAVERKRAELEKQLREIREADAKLAEFIEQVRQKVKDSWNS